MQNLTSKRGERYNLQREKEVKVNFLNKDEALSILGEQDIFLQKIATAFAVDIFSQGSNLVLKGNYHNVLLAQNTVEYLQKLVRQGIEIEKEDVSHAIYFITNKEKEQLVEVDRAPLFKNAKGKDIRPKTIGQSNYVQAIAKNYITFGVGPAGTGKTYLACTMAVKALKNHEVERLIISRPALEAGEHLGFLPGDIKDKVDPYLRPIYDALGDILGKVVYQNFINRGVIEASSLAHMRGRTLNNAFIILDEAQNTTNMQMKMFLTRFGKNSKMVINGDLSQTDLAGGKKSSGLFKAVHILKAIKGIKIVNFSLADVVRHEIVSKIISAYENFNSHYEKQDEV